MLRSRITRAISKWGPHAIAVVLFATLAAMLGCGGAAGVDDGIVTGRVFSDASSASSARSPLGAVDVVLRRQSPTPLVIRRTLTDANGNFVFTSVPVGSYTVGYSKQGFLPIDPVVTTTTTRTNQVGRDLIVESGQTVQVPDVIMETDFQSGSGTLILTVLDGATGDPVTFATVTAGVVVSSNGGNNGVYTLSVPILPNDSTTRASTPQENAPKGVLVQADGYLINRFDVGLVANETVRRTVFMNPLAVDIDGVIKIAKFQNLINVAQVIGIATNTESVASAPIVGVILPTGEFAFHGVPASNSNLTRTFNLRFTHPDLQTLVITNVVAPRAGDRTIPLSVVMTPLTVDVTGTVLVSTPSVATPVPQPDTPGNGTAVIVETGQSAAIVNGNYTIAGVPVRQAPGDTPLTLNARAFDTFGQLKSGTLTISPVSDGSPNPIFVVTPLRLQ